MPGMIRKWRARLRHGAQTRTAAVTPDTVAAARQTGTAAAYRRAVGMLLLVQGMLWSSLTGVGVAGRTVWQAALSLIPAGLAVWAVSRWVWGTGAESGGDAPSRPGQRTGGNGRWETLLLWPCLLLDGIWLIHALLSLLYRLMPSYPAGVLRVVAPGLLTLGVLLGKRNGAAFGVSLWRWILPLLAAWVMFHVLRDQGLDQVYPLLGRGVAVTGKAALTGLGSLWPAGLLFLLPECSGGLDPETGKPPRTVQYVLLSLALACVHALVLVCAAAWYAADDPSAGLRLLLTGRSSGSMMISGLWALFWLLGLMTAFCSTLMAGQKITTQVFPRCSPIVPVLGAALPGAVLLWIWPDELPVWFEQLLPWRLLLWATAAVWAAVRRGSRKRAGGMG